MKTRQILLSVVATTCLFTSQVNATYSPSSNTSIDKTINLHAVEQDMQFLASDQRQGRSIGSQGILEAEDYIAAQFKSLGLKYYGNNESFKQKFQLHHFLPTEINVTLNNESIAKENLAFIGTAPTIDWNEQKVNVVSVSADDDIKEVMNNLNSQGDNALVLVHPNHAELFTRYQKSFQRGIKTTSQKQRSSLVLALTDLPKVTSLKVLAKVTQNKMNVANMVAVLPGTEKADEFIIFSAHHDHLGVKQNSNADKIYNGANDDASGVTAVLNLARHFSQTEHKRSIMFVTFTAEESGLIGSKYFTDFIDADKIKAMINIEMIGKASEFGAGKYWMTGFERSNLADIFNKNLKPNDSQVYADPYLKYGLFYRSDNASLAKLGVAAHSFSSTQISNDEDYHQASDDLASLDLAQMTDVIKSIAMGSKSLINGEDTPSKIELAEPKAPRLIY
ncbi:M28 family metallopeptidase [Thalassomonas sp. M1454]|uniref:M28 family metallopeptidase n=1 Tax=Thalassomonas sp. M1454 TaxID=2594477 RepID=UPI00163DE39A|nr:M20/M25/M40 family metallo-hydrolase [Thalassomonas sp. M1454]